MKHPHRKFRALPVALTGVATMLCAASASAASYPFTAEHEIAHDAAGEPVWADIDNDGDRDIVGRTGDALTWYENVGGLDQDFSPHTIEPELLQLSHTVADMDGDGDLDVVGAGDDEVRWYENISDGEAFIPHTVGVAEADAIAVGDFDGDGHLDIAIAGSDDPAWFQNPGDATGDWGGIKVIPSALFYPDDVTAGDYDGDGRDELIAADGYNEYLSLLSFADGPWEETALPVEGGIQQMRTIDYDLDGDLDVLSGRSTRAMVLNNVAPGVFGSEIFMDTEFSGHAFRLDAGDIDLDGDLDIFGLHYNGGYWFENDGGTYVEHDLGIQAGIQGSAVSMADADCDGDADAVVQQDYGYTIYVNETVDAVGDECGGNGGGDDGGGNDDGADDGGGADGGDGGSDGGDDEAGNDDGDDGEAATSGAADGDGDGEDPLAGMCSVGPRPAAPLSMLALVMLALGRRRRS